MTRRLARPSVGRWRACLGLSVAAALLVGACGASPTTAPGSPEATTSPAATPAGSAASSGPPSTAVPLPPGAFTVALPAGWKAVPVAGDHAALIAEIRNANPAFADALASRLANLAATATYVAFDDTAAAIANGRVVTLVVTEVELPPTVSLQTFTNTVQEQVQQLTEQPVEAKRIVIASGEAYDLEFIAPIQRSDGSQATAAITQVLYVVPGRGYVMTFTAPPSVAPSYGKTFAEIATSFRIST